MHENIFVIDKKVKWFLEAWKVFVREVILWIKSSTKILYIHLSLDMIDENISVLK